MPLNLVWGTPSLFSVEPLPLSQCRGALTLDPCLDDARRVPSKARRTAASRASGPGAQPPVGGRVVPDAAGALGAHRRKDPRARLPTAATPRREGERQLDPVGVVERDRAWATNARESTPVTRTVRGVSHCERTCADKLSAMTSPRRTGTALPIKRPIGLN